MTAISALKNIIELDLRDNNMYVQRMGCYVLLLLNCIIDLNSLCSTTLAALRKLRRLERLDISYNSISSMDCLHHLGWLHVLSGNVIIVPGLTGCTIY